MARGVLLGRRVSLYGNAGGESSPFHPNDIFNGDGVGDWWTTKDLTKFFKDNPPTDPVTANDDAIAAFVGQRGYRNLINNTAANRPLMKNRDTTPEINHDNSNDALAVNATAGTFMHDGTGGSAWAIANASSNKRFWGSKASNASHVAVGMNLSRNGGKSRVMVSNGSTGQSIDDPATNPWASGIHFIGMSFDINFLRLYFDGVMVNEVATSFTPASTGASIALSTAPLITEASDKWRAGGFVNNVISEANFEKLFEWHVANGDLA